MRFKTDEYMTIKDLQSDEYREIKEELKSYKEKDFISDINIYDVGNVGNKEILKLENVMIARERESIIIWIKVIARDSENFYEINCNFHDSSNNFTVTFERKSQK